VKRDGSRVEAAEAGVHTEQEELGAHDHVDAVDSVSVAHHTPDEHDDHGGHGGHGADPNAGVLVGTPPTPAWLMTVTLVALVTIAGCVLLAVKIG
jgi:hypothetical protein